LTFNKIPLLADYDMCPSCLLGPGEECGEWKGRCGDDMVCQYNAILSCTGKCVSKSEFFHRKEGEKCGDIDGECSTGLQCQLLPVSIWNFYVEGTCVKEETFNLLKHGEPCGGMLRKFAEKCVPNIFFTFQVIFGLDQTKAGSTITTTNTSISSNDTFSKYLNDSEKSKVSANSQSDAIHGKNVDNAELVVEDTPFQRNADLTEVEDGLPVIDAFKVAGSGKNESEGNLQNTIGKPVNVEGKAVVYMNEKLLYTDFPEEGPSDFKTLELINKGEMKTLKDDEIVIVYDNSIKK